MRRVLIPPELSPALWVQGAPSGRLHSFAGETMGTTWSVQLALPASLPPEDVHAQLKDKLDSVVAQMSHWSTTSDLSRFNEAPPNIWQTLPSELFNVLECGLQLARDTNGAYDPTIGTLTNLWGFGPRGKRSTPPRTADIEDSKAHCGWQGLELDRVNLRARHNGNVQLDLSGIAKGFAVDWLAEHLNALRIEHYLVEVGGELRGRGCKSDGSPWWVTLELPAPEGTRGLRQTMIALHDLSVATSGDYRRYFNHCGRRYSHTIDPRIGYPVRDQIAAVSVLHTSCMQADALATALTVLGPSDALEYAKSRQIAALFVLRTPQGFDEQLTPALMSFLDEQIEDE